MPAALLLACGLVGLGLRRRPQLRMLAQYFKPDFHPRDCDDERYLRAWRAAPEGAWTANE